MPLLDPKLEAFIAVAKQKSMHGAAKLIHLSQTAITQRIRILEQKLRATLFIRTSHGVEITPDGEALLRYCNTILALEGETLAKINGAGVSSEVRLCICGPNSIMKSRIIPQCLAIMANYPQLLITFDINDSEHRIHSLQKGMSQFVIIEPEYISKEMKIKPLVSEKYVLLCNPGWKDRKLKEIIESERIIDFDEADQLTLHYLRQYHLFDLAKPGRHFINRTDSLADMIADGHGYGVLTTEFCKPYVDNKQLCTLNSGKHYEHSLVLAWYERPEPPKYFSDIIDIII